MKKIVYILFFVFAFASGFGQKDSLEVFTVVEEMPEFQGGTYELMKFLQENIEYPMAAKERGQQGKPFVKFIIDSTGNITNVAIAKSSEFRLLDEEAMRVVNCMPKWKPGLQNGKAVNVQYNLPMNFKMSGGRSSKSEISDKEYANFYYNMGVKYSQAKKHELAISSFSKALEYNHFDIDALYNRGAMYLKLKEEDKACMDWYAIKSLGKSDADELLEKYCKDSSTTTKETFSPVEKMPEYPGGGQELLKFIQDNLKYPKGVKNSDLKCNKVFLKFVIQEDGSLKDIEITKSSGNILVDEEAKRVISIMPKWIPGQQNEKAVPVFFNLPIRFADYNVQCTNK